MNVTHTESTPPRESLTDLGRGGTRSCDGRAPKASYDDARSRRRFLITMGASAVTLSAARSLAAPHNPLPGPPPAPGRVRIGVVGGGFGAAFQWHLHPISAIREDRQPEVNVWEAIAYTMPGLIAHRSALEGGACLKIPDYGTAPA